MRTIANVDDDAPKPAKTTTSKKVKHSKVERAHGSSTETKVTTEKTDKPPTNP